MQFWRHDGQHFSYITQMTWTTKFGSSKGLLPSNSPEIVLHAFRHSTLIVPWFQEDLGFEQLEPDKSMFKIRTCLQVTWHGHVRNSELYIVTPPHCAPSLSPPSPTIPNECEQAQTSTNKHYRAQMKVKWTAGQARRSTNKGQMSVISYISISTTNQ